MYRGQGLLTPIKASRMDADVGMVGGAEVGAVVVCPQPTRSFVLALASEDADEGLLEFAAVAWINDGIQATVEVAQPKYHFKKGLWGTQACIKRA